MRFEIFVSRSGTFWALMFCCLSFVFSCSSLPPKSSDSGRAKILKQAPMKTSPVEPFANSNKPGSPLKPLGGQRGSSGRTESEATQGKQGSIIPKATVPKHTLPVEIVISFGGDISLNRSGELPHETGTGTGNRLTPWAKVTAGIAPLLTDSEINFGNIETVVTGRHDLSRTTKKYTFQSHLTGIKHLVDIGLNLFSLANNHAYDFGEPGARETLSSMNALAETRPQIHFAGLGVGETAAARPTVFEVKGKRIAFAAIGIISNMDVRHRVGPGKGGTLRFRDPKDYQLVLGALAQIKADYKILSIHYGTERDVKVDRRQRATFKKAFDKAGVDLILGHHAHVVRAVQRTEDNRVAFYGLGNYIMRGARNMGPLPDPQDYGLFGKIYLTEDKVSKRLVAQAIEVIPLTAMHWNARPLSGVHAARRIEVLNGLNRKTFKDQAINFQQKSNRGVTCFGRRLGPRARAICSP